MAKNNGTQVYLVGAGPGDEGLLTLRGFEVLQKADLVIYDGLVNPAILDFSPASEKCLIGKVGKKLPLKKQEQIYQTMMRFIKQGKIVVRLKGGDPFVFGRGGEEASFLHKHRISFEVVPGVSAGHGVPAYAGIPITDRRLSSAAIFVAAYEDTKNPETAVKWKDLAKIHGTLVLFMGVKRLREVTSMLIRFGKSPRTLMTVIEWGTWPHQRVVEGTLENIAARVKKAKIQSPAISIIGEVNRFRKELQWFEKKPLYGKRIMLTRASSQMVSLKSTFRDLGAQVVEFPVIEIQEPLDWAPVDEAIRRLPTFDWVLFTSVNGVQYFMKRVFALGKDARIFGKIKIGCIGDATQQALIAFGLCADRVPAQFTSEALFKELSDAHVIRGNRFLLPRTQIAPAFLRESLEQEGAEVTEVIAYRTIESYQNSKRKKMIATLCGEKAVDFVTFTSASTVHATFSGWGQREKSKIKSKLISIGPVTSETIRSHGLKPYLEAKEHTMQGMITALKNLHRRKS